jgi:hypothetical protein
MLFPAVKPDIPLIGAVGLVIVDPPDNTVHRPIPVVGVFAVKIAVPGAIQTV